MEKKYLEYSEGSTTCEGYIAHEAGAKKPAVLVCHAWGGQSDVERGVAERLSELGYVGFAVDVYGKGKRGGPGIKNEDLLAPFLQDRALLKRRLDAAVDFLRTHPAVDSTRMAVIGYCFGGLCALDLARSANPLIKGAVSVHGLFVPSGLPEKTITAKVLALHGYEDPMVPPEQVLEFAQEMKRASADWQLHAYGNTVHGFTFPKSHDPARGIMYNEVSAKRAWRAMTNFLGEALA